MRKNLWRWRSVPGLLHEEYTWVCFNGLSLNCTDVTDVEDSCEHWEKRTDENGIEDYEVN